MCGKNRGRKSKGEGKLEKKKHTIKKENGRKHRPAFREGRGVLPEWGRKETPLQPLFERGIAPDRKRLLLVGCDGATTSICAVILISLLKIQRAEHMV